MPCSLSSASSPAMSARVVAASDDRFRGLCNVYMANATAAIAELRWCNAQGMAGIMVHGNEQTVLTDGSVHLDFYYKESSLVIWREVARLVAATG